ncbi:MAG: biopolymer transporter ExbD [Flavobacteriales bacterium]|nr:biopolymer transporter ExbD [Flavobacteriales bacterium]
MADAPGGGEEGGGGKRHQKKRAKKGSTRIDMTPMVDLAFLLLTFFILTTTMYKPSTLQMTFPVPDEDPTDDKKTELSNAITLILTAKDQIFYYLGEFHTPTDGSGKPPTTLTRTDFSKVRQVLLERNKEAVEKLNQLARDFNSGKITEAAYDSLRRKTKGDPTNLKAIIKTDKDAKYRNMIDIVDEMDISGIGSYGVLDSLKTAEQLLLDAEKATI